MDEFNLFGLKFVQHPLLNDYRTEVYRGSGGYKFRWTVRKERQVLDRKIYIFPKMNMAFMSPQSADIIKGFTNV